MGKSLENRLNGHAEEFLLDIKRYGDFGALELWSEKLGGYKNYIGLRKFVLAKTGDPSYGLRPSIDTADTSSTLRKLVREWSQFYLEVSTENKRLRERNEQLEKMIKIRVIEETELFLPLLEAIKETK